jgi:dipeptidyl aminopeptidase/acylaminoacyl peptidase
VTFWDRATGAKLREFPSDLGRLTYRPDGQVLAVSGPDAAVLHDVATGHELRRLPHGPGEAAERSVRFFAREGPDLAFSPDGRRLVVATNPPRVWDTTTGQLRGPLTGSQFLGRDRRGIAVADLRTNRPLRAV